MITQKLPVTAVQPGRESFVAFAILLFDLNDDGRAALSVY